MPCSFPTFIQYKRATSLALTVSVQGIKWHIFVALSTTVKIVSLPSHSGIPLMKSIATWSHFLAGISKGCNSPPGFKLLPFSAWHTGQSRNKISHVWTHMFPIKELFRYLHRTSKPRVPRVRDIMKLMQNHSFQIYIIWDNNSPIISHLVLSFFMDLEGPWFDSVCLFVYTDLIWLLWVL